MVTVTITIKPYLARYMYVRYAQSLEPESESRPHLLRQPLSENRFLSISLTSLPSIIFSISYPSRIHPKYPGKKQEISRLFCLIQPTERIRKYIIISGRKAH